MKKQILSLCMVLALCLLPATALAADGDTVYVGGVALTGSTDALAYATTGDDGSVSTAGANENNWNIKWDGSTLTLKEAYITRQINDGTNPINGAAIGVFNQNGNAELTIQLENSNTVSASTGIYVYSSTGTASLTITGGGSLNASEGIRVQSNSGNAALTIQNAKVEAIVTSSSGDGVLVQAGNGNNEGHTAKLEVDGGSLTATGKSDYGAGIRYIFGDSDSGSGTPSLTVSGNTIVRTNGGISNNSSANIQIGADNNSSGGIVFNGNAGTVYGDVTLQKDLNIGTGESLALDDGASLDTGGHNVIVDGGTVDHSIKTSLGESVKYTPTITTTNLPSGTANAEYSTTLAADGTMPIRWSITSGKLPAGLRLDGSTGAITGTPTAEGISTFTVTAANDYGSDSQAFALTIDEPTVISVTGVSLDKTSLTLTEGGSDTLNATVTPDNATNKTVTWESNNTSVATVENGKVTAHSAGTAAITVKTADGGYEVTCFVTVKHGNMTHTPENAATCTEDGNKEYWTCGICGKHFSDAEGKVETSLFDTVVLEKGHSYVDGKCSVCEAIDSGFQPAIITGAGGTWQKGAKAGLSFTSNAAFADFVKIQVDGKDLAASNYEVKEGSTVVTLKTSYLETLSVGKHTLAIVSDTGTAATGFTINAAPVTDDDTQSSETGDNTNIALWIVMVLASGTGLTVTAIYRIKNHFGKR